MSSAQGYSQPSSPVEDPEQDCGEDQRVDQEDDQVEQPQCTPPVGPELELQPEPETQQVPENQPELEQVPEDQPEPEPQQEPEPVASFSNSQSPDQPPEIPPKDHDLEATLSFLNSPRISQILDWSSTPQPSFTAAGQLMSHNTTRPHEHHASNTAGARPLTHQHIAAGHDGTHHNPNVSNRNTTGTRPGRNTTTAAYANPEAIRPLPAPTSGAPPNLNRSQVHLPPSRPLSSSLERRPTGPGLISYDPIRGDSGFQPSYLPDMNGYDGGGDPAGVPNRNSGRRGSVRRTRSTAGPTDGTMVENEPGNWAGSRRASRLMSGQDWLVGVPVVEQPPRKKTLEDRLKPTVDAAIVERNKLEKRSSQQNIIINGAIALQIVVGALTTGVAASGTKHIGSVVAALGGLSTILASYLAKVRGSGEPEFSTIRMRELNSFLREVETFIMDHGDETGTEHNDQIATFRERFEAIIKTDGEDSGTGPRYSHQAPPTHAPSPLHAAPPVAHLTSGHPGTMPGAYNHPGSHEKQVLYKEKAIDAVA